MVDNALLEPTSDDTVIVEEPRTVSSVFNPAYALFLPAMTKLNKTVKRVLLASYCNGKNDKSIQAWSTFLLECSDKDGYYVYLIVYTDFGLNDSLLTASVDDIKIHFWSFFGDIPRIDRLLTLTSVEMPLKSTIPSMPEINFCDPQPLNSLLLEQI